MRCILYCFYKLLTSKLRKALTVTFLLASLPLVGQITEMTLETNGQVVSGNKTFTGTNVHSGSETFSNITPNLNGTLPTATTSTIATLINAGGSVVIPPGNYVLTTDLLPPANTSVLCQGWGAKFTLPSVTGAHSIFTITSANNVKIIGCQLDGTGMTASTADSHLIRVVSSSGFLLDSSWLHDSPEDCVRLGPSINSGNVLNSRITNNLLANCGTIGPSGSGVGATDATGNIIDHNTITTPHLDGVDIEPQCVACDGSKNTIDTNYLQGAGFSSNGISLFNHNGGTQQNNTVVGNTVLQFAGGTCIIVVGNTDGTVVGNTMFACVNGLELQNSTLLTAYPNDFKSNTTGILMDGASNTNNEVGGNVNNSTTGFTETNSSNGNTFHIKFAANTNNFGNVGGNSEGDWDTGNGGKFLLIPGQNTACYTIEDAPASSTHKMSLCPNLPGTAFNGIVQGGDDAILYNSTQGFAIAPNSGTSGLRLDSTGNATETGNLTVSGGAVTAPSYKTTNLLISSTAPTIAAAGCGGAAASITANNGTAAFNINVGTTPTSGGCTVTMPAATTGWNCDVNDMTTNSTSVFYQKQTGAISTTSVVLQNFSDVAVATAPTASDIYHVQCSAY